VREKLGDSRKSAERRGLVKEGIILIKRKRGEIERGWSNMGRPSDFSPF